MLRNSSNKPWWILTLGLWRKTFQVSYFVSLGEYISETGAAVNEGKEKKPGRLFVLPMNFKGGNRYIWPQNFGVNGNFTKISYPNILLIMAWNVKWKKIHEALFLGETARSMLNISAAGSSIWDWKCSCNGEQRSVIWHYRDHRHDDWISKHKSSTLALYLLYG